MQDEWSGHVGFLLRRLGVDPEKSQHPEDGRSQLVDSASRFAGHETDLETVSIEISQNLGRMFEGQGDMQVFLDLVKLGRKVRLIWQRVASLNEMMDLLQFMAT